MIDIDAAARRLLTLRKESRTVPSLPEGERPSSLTEAYAVQDRLAELTGERTVAWKVGASSPGVQGRLGFSEPFSGRYQAPFVVDHPAVLAWERFATRPGVECEMGLRLGRDVDPVEGPLDAETVADAVDAVVPTIEVVAGRFDNPMAAEPASLVADNGMAGYLILGDPIPLAEAPDLSRVHALLRVNGDQVASGDVAAAGFDPWQTVAWLAGHLAQRRIGLRAGTVVSTGSLTGVHFVRPGDGIVADLGPLGWLSVMITD